MKPYYRLLMRGTACVGVAVVHSGNVTLVTELSGRPEAIDSFMDEIPKHSENADEWFYALSDLLPMTYKIGNIARFDGDDPNGADANESAHNLAAELIVVDARSSRLSTTRVVTHATIDDAGVEADGAAASTLRGRDEEDEAQVQAEAEVEEAEEAGESVVEDESEHDESEDESEADEIDEPEEPREASPDIVVVNHELSREPLSIADDGAGLHEQWFILLEDWQGLAAIFAGDREGYYVLSRSTTQLISEQITEAVPTQAANLEHWVTMLIRNLPSGVWLRSFTSARSVTEETLETPLDVLRAAIAFYGTPGADRNFEAFGSGQIDGSLSVDPDSGELTAAQEAAAEASADEENETADASS